MTTPLADSKKYNEQQLSAQLMIVSYVVVLGLSVSVAIKLDWLFAMFCITSVMLLERASYAIAYFPEAQFKDFLNVND